MTRGAWAFTKPHRPQNLNFLLKESPKIVPIGRMGVGGKENGELGGGIGSRYYDDRAGVGVLGFAIRWWMIDEGRVGATG